jgi:hypothetical protein
VSSGNPHACFVLPDDYGLNNQCEQNMLFESYISGKKPDQYSKKGRSNDICYSTWWYFPHLKKLALNYGDRYSAYLLLTDKSYSHVKKTVSFSETYFEDYLKEVLIRYQKSEISAFGQIISDELLAKIFLGSIEVYEGYFMSNNTKMINKLKTSIANDLFQIKKNGFENFVKISISRLPAFIPISIQKEIKEKIESSNIIPIFKGK